MAFHEQLLMTHGWIQTRGEVLKYAGAPTSIARDTHRSTNAQGVVGGSTQLGLLRI